VPRKATGGGIGIIVIALIAMYFGVDPTVILNQQSPPTSSVSTDTTSKPISPADNQLADFVSIEEALNAASAIGDDRLQRKGRGYVTPDSFTHGSSKQRVH
jgi:predicted metalloprotease